MESDQVGGYPDGEKEDIGVPDGIDQVTCEGGQDIEAGEGPFGLGFGEDLIPIIG